MAGACQALLSQVELLAVLRAWVEVAERLAEVRRQEVEQLREQLALAVLAVPVWGPDWVVPSLHRLPPLYPSRRREEVPAVRC